MPYEPCSCSCHSSPLSAANECCEKCRGYTTKAGAHYFPLCNKKDCACHLTYKAKIDFEGSYVPKAPAANESEWEKELDEKFPDILGFAEDRGVEDISADVKMFFRSVLAVKLSEREREAYQAGQDKAIYEMDEQAKNHWFDEGKKAERQRIKAALPSEDGSTPDTPEIKGMIPITEPQMLKGWRACRAEVLKLLDAQ